jgi:hypothetical protein
MLLNPINNNKTNTQINNLLRFYFPEDFFFLPLGWFGAKLPGFRDHET